MFHLLGEFKTHLSQEEEEEASIFKQNKILLRNECSS
jgi:hypothetical protein